MSEKFDFNLKILNQLSIRGRVLFGIKTIEQYILEHKLDNEILQVLLKNLWLFIEKDDLSFWESKIENYNPINILDVSEGNIYTNYDNLTEDDFNEIQKYYKNVNTNFLEIISLTIEIGSFYLYSGFSGFSHEFILLTNKLYSISNCMLEEPINISNIYQYYLVSKTNYWGERKNKILFK